MVDWTEAQCKLHLDPSKIENYKDTKKFNQKMPSEMEVAPRFKLLTLFNTVFTANTTYSNW